MTADMVQDSYHCQYCYH